MRVGLDLVYLGAGAGGAGRYARELVRALLEEEPGLELVLFTAKDAPEDLRAEPWARDVRWVRMPVRCDGPGGLVAHLATVPLSGLGRRLDVLHAPAGVTSGALGRALPVVVTILDVIWLLLPDQVVMTERQRQAWERWTRLSARRATSVVAISEAAGSDLRAAFDLPAGKVHVTPLGVRDTAAAPAAGDVRARLGLGPGPVVLSVGQLHPYKNQAALVRALAELPRRDVQLVLPGRPSAYGEEVRALATELGVADRVHLLGYVSEADVEALYALATLAAQPSRMEGFGLPVLEAMQRGLPVVCSDRSAVREVAEGAALLFDPDAPAEVAAALARGLEDAALRERLVAAGRARVAEYTWARCARATLEVYRSASA